MSLGNFQDVGNGFDHDFKTSNTEARVIKSGRDCLVKLLRSCTVQGEFVELRNKEGEDVCWN